MDKNFAAFTAPGGLPAFVSINDRAGGVEITVRSAGTPDGNAGAMAVIRLTPAEFRALAEEALRRL